MADLSWRTGSIFSCCKGLWDCRVLKPIRTKHQSVFWLVSQSRRMSAICVGICRWISFAAVVMPLWYHVCCCIGFGIQATRTNIHITQKKYCLVTNLHVFVFWVTLWFRKMKFDVCDSAKWDWTITGRQQKCRASCSCYKFTGSGLKVSNSCWNGWRSVSFHYHHD